MFDIIHISMEDWDGVWRRNQNVAAGLARRFPERKILYVNLPINLSHALRRGRWDILASGWRPVAPQPLPEIPNIYVFSPIKVFPNTLLPGRLANEAIARAQIKRAARAIGLDRPLLYINPYWAAHMPGRMGERAVVYDVGDDWTALGQNQWVRRRIIAEDDSLTRRADAVIVVSQQLADMKRALARKVHLIPNGVDVERYAPISERTLPAHPLTAQWSRPVLGHTGTLHTERTNADLILQVARAFPTGTIALVGPNHLTEAENQRLRAEPNVRLVGPVDYREIPRIMSGFDVCFVPHRVTPFSESNSPLKLFEYLASGLPIVSTPVSGFRDFPELVHLAQEDEAFIAGIHAALHEPDDLPVRRRRAAAQHTWDARIDDYLRVFQDFAGVRSAPCSSGRTVSDCCL